MGLESDPLDDLFSDNAAKNAKLGGKFRPKAKLKPRKPSSVSVQSTQCSQPVTRSEKIVLEKASENTVDEFAGVPPSDDNRSSALRNVLSEQIVSGQNTPPTVSLHSEAIVGVNYGNWNYYFRNSEGEGEDILSGLDVLDGSLPQSTTITETPKVQIATMRKAEVGFCSAKVSPDDQTLRVGNTAESCSFLEAPVAIDTLTYGESAVSNASGDFDAERLNMEEGEAFHCLEILDNAPEFTISSDAAVPEPSEADKLDKSSIPMFPLNDVIDFSSIELDDSIRMDPTFELPVNDETENLIGASQSGASIPGEHTEILPAVPEFRGKSSTSMVSELPEQHQQTSPSDQEEEAGRFWSHRSKQTYLHKKVNESDDKGVEGEQFATECPSGSDVNEDNNDEEYQLENERKCKRVRGKSKRTGSENGKSVRKHRKGNESLDQQSKKPVKKFSHSTRRRGRFDKDWLKQPEDDIDLTSLPLRDIILLGEYREWTEKNKPQASETPSMNQSAAYSSPSYYEDDDAFASQQGRESNDEQGHETVQESTTYFNYHTHMNKTPRGRWTKQDTELFYEAVQQFGTNLSMMAELFPGRSRNQLKMKYKKEEREHPMRLHEALTNPSKDLSHLQLMAKRFEQAAKERGQNSSIDYSDGLTTEEPEGVTSETREEAKSEQLDAGKVEQKEQEVQREDDENLEVAQSPVKSSDSEDDFYRWSDYKSEL